MINLKLYISLYHASYIHYKDREYGIVANIETTINTSPV